MLACFCLNITIETSPNDFQKVTPQSLGLSEEEKNDKFFKQEVYKVGKLLNISKVHSFLVKTRNVGAWTISRCINCDCHTHAVHRKKGASFVVIYSKLLNSSAISSVKSSDIFSTIYNIVVNPNDIGLEANNPETYRYLPPFDAEPALRMIRDIMSESIGKESVAVDKRIKQYTEKQYDQLNSLKERAFKEYESLCRVIYNAVEPESTKTSSSPSASSSSRPSKQTDRKKSSQFSEWMLDRSDKISPSKTTDSDELIFDFESDEVNSTQSTDMEESDREADKEEGISIPRSVAAPRPNMAKSLPMNIPAFATKPRHGGAEEFDDTSPVGENVDIAASIKALAKSVHGDPVFGDLPRPRFSTQL